MDRELWEQEALNWVQWSRRPGHDAYWFYAATFFDELVPRATRTLDVGCGEGLSTRDLRDRGHSVTGLDASTTLVAHAVAVDPDSSYLLDDAHALPFRDAAFDLVVAYNSLMDVDDMPLAVAESSARPRRNGPPMRLRHAPVERRGWLPYRRPGARLRRRQLLRQATGRRGRGT